MIMIETVYKKNGDKVNLLTSDRIIQKVCNTNYGSNDGGTRVVNVIFNSSMLNRGYIPVMVVVCGSLYFLCLKGTLATSSLTSINEYLTHVAGEDVLSGVQHVKTSDGKYRVKFSMIPGHSSVSGYLSVISLRDDLSSGFYERIYTSQS